MKKNIKLLKQYFKLLIALQKEPGKILFVSSLDEQTCSFIRDCAIACNQEYITSPDWVYGTLTNSQ
jgi:ribosomal protein S2